MAVPGRASTVEGRHLDTELDYDARTADARARRSASRAAGSNGGFVLRERCFSDAEVEGALVAPPGFAPEIAAPWSPVDPRQPEQDVVCSGK